MTAVRLLGERLAAKTLKASCGCHLWLGASRGTFGHGSIYDHSTGRRVATHRAAYEIANGAIPDGMCVLHRCDVPECVNPEHLFLGTPADNNADMVAKGRNARGHGDTMRRSKLFVSTRPRGEANTESKVTDSVVRAIRCRYAAGGVSQQALANEYGISQRAVSCIVLRQTWAHVKEGF